MEVTDGRTDEPTKHVMRHIRITAW